MKRLHLLLRFDMMDSLTLHPIWVVAGSILGTLPIVSACSLYFHGVVTWDYLITGLITSTIVASFAIGLLNYADARALSLVRDSEEQYRTMVENSNDMIWTLTADGRFTFINQQAADVTGRSIEDWLGKTFEPLVMEEDLPMALEIHGKVMSGEKIHYEVRVKKTDGGILTLSVNSSPIFKDGKVSGTISFASDITERKQAEETLRSAHEDLLKKSGRLEMFQRVAVDREMRMVEMKDEVNGLLERLGEPRKYVEIDDIRIR